jgi:hypothetical protein
MNAAISHAQRSDLMPPMPLGDGEALRAARGQTIYLQTS